MENQFIGPVVGSLTALIGLYAGFAKLKSDFKKEIESEKTKDLDLLNSKISAIRSEIENLEASIQKEIEFVKQTHNSEIRNLGEKLDELRDEVRGQHSQLVALLSKLITER